MVSHVEIRFRLGEHDTNTLKLGGMQKGEKMQLDAIGIVVNDINKALPFYRLLGLDFPERSSEDHLEAKTKSGVRIMLDSEKLMKEIKPGWTRPPGQSIGLAFLCDSPNEVNALYGKITAAGFKSEKEPWDTFWGQRYAIVRDPDGHAIDLFAAL